MTYTPEQLREEATQLERENCDVMKVDQRTQIALLRAHADALEELAKAQSALAESERKGERGCFCLMEMMQAYERRVRSLCAPEEIEKRPWECAEYNKAAEYLRAVWKPDAYRAEFKEE